MEVTDVPFVTYARNVPNHRCRHERISERAYFKWLAAAKPMGRDLEFWIAAEEEERSHSLEIDFPAAAAVRGNLAGVVAAAGPAIPSERFSRAPRSLWPIT
jgi:hypothetical protein